MRKILLITLGLLFINGLMMAEACARPQRRTPPGPPAKITDNEYLINDAFSTIFGRKATPDEMNQWKKSDLTREELVGKLVEFLKSRAGAGELRQTIERGFPISFGRAPNPTDSTFWQSEARAKSYGFSALYAAYSEWLKTPAADSERKSIVFKSCFEALGRIPSVSESNQWRDMIEKTGEAYFQMVIFTHNLLFAGNPDYEKERSGMIKRAFLTAGKPQPTDGDYKFWMPEIEKQDLTFKKLAAMLKDQPRGGAKLNGEPAVPQQDRAVVRPSAENETSIQKLPQTQGNSRVKVINLTKSNEQQVIAKSRDLTLGKPFKLSVLSTNELLKAMETSPHAPPELKTIAPNNLSDYVKLTPQQPYVAGKGSLNFSNSSVDTEQNVASLGNANNFSLLFATFTPSAAGRNYLIEFGIRAGDLDPEHQHNPIVVGIGGFFVPDEVSQQYLKYDDHQLVFFHTAKTTDPITISISSTAGVLFKYFRVVELK